MFANGPGDLGSIPGWVIPNTDGTQVGTTVSGGSGTASNGNEGVIYTLKIPRTGASPPDTV